MKKYSGFIIMLIVLIAFTAEESNGIVGKICNSLQQDTIVDSQYKENKQIVRPVCVLPVGSVCWLWTGGLWFYCEIYCQEIKK